MIPKKIHYCWFGNGPKSKLAEKCIASWKKHCPDYEIIEWNESNIDISTNKFAKQAYDAKKWGFVPDYWRLWIIYNHGGIYLDTDVELVKSLDNLLIYPGFAGYEDANHVALGLGFGAEKGNPVIAEMMRQYDAMLFINDDGSYNLTPSPLLNTDVFRNRYNLGKDDGTVKCYPDFAVLPAEYLCPMNHDTGKINRTSNTVSIHHFEGTWVPGKRRSLRQSYYRHKLNSLIHFPNRVLLNLLGKNTYQSLVNHFKR